VSRWWEKEKAGGQKMSWPEVRPTGNETEERSDVLSIPVEAYEARTFPMDLPDPVEAILFRMEHQGLKPKDLEPMIGKRNRVYERRPWRPCSADFGARCDRA
jgi:hypothetical protein